MSASKGRLSRTAKYTKNRQPTTAISMPTANHKTAKYAAKIPQMIISAMRGNIDGGVR